MPFTLHDWFCLKDGRESFRPSDPEDRELIFCHDQVISEEVIGNIEKHFATGRPVKMLIYGDWGVGKTHLTHHICWWLEENKAHYAARPIMIEIGDVTKNSRFDTLVRPFLDELDLPLIVDLVHGYLAKKPNVVRGLQEAGVSNIVAEAYGKLLMAAPGVTPPPIVLYAFDFLRGRKPPPAAASMGLGQAIQESQDFYHVLLGLGEMYKTVHGHRLIFIADEGAKLEAVDSDEATRAHWVNANKLIFDDKNKTFGFIYTISGRRKTLPQALFEPQLQNRLGDAIFELKTLGPQDVEGFLNKLVSQFVDKTRVEAMVADGTINAAEYVWEAYPFNQQARADFIDYFNRTQGDAKPRDIADKLDDVAFIAGKTGKRLIDVESLKKKNM